MRCRGHVRNDPIAFSRKLFADDAETVLPLIDICQTKFDVVLMNPPFGEFAKPTKAWAATESDPRAHGVTQSIDFSKLDPRMIMAAIRSY